MSTQSLPDLSPSARAMAANQSIIEQSIKAFLTQRSDELAAAAGREDWNEVQKISLQLAEESRAQGYRGISARAQRVHDQTHRPDNQQEVKRSLIRLIGTCGQTLR